MKRTTSGLSRQTGSPKNISERACDCGAFRLSIFREGRFERGIDGVPINPAREGRAAHLFAGFPQKINSFLTAPH
jgi:hypothetical protein